jgi:hypothetical protein
MAGSIAGSSDREYRRPPRFDSCVTKHIGLLSFGHWMPFRHWEAQSGLDVLLQLIDLEVAAEGRVQTAPTSECTTWPGSLARRSLLDRRGYFMDCTLTRPNAIAAAGFRGRMDRPVDSRRRRDYGPASRSESASSRKAPTTARKRSGSSTCGMWLDFSNSSHREPTTRLWISSMIRGVASS